MVDRYFATIFAPSRKALLRLREYGLDIFEVTAREAKDGDAKAAETEEPGYSVEGLLTLEQVGRLAKDGYRVRVDDAADKRAHGRRQPIEFDEWLEGMKDVLEQQRRTKD